MNKAQVFAAGISLLLLAGGCAVMPTKGIQETGAAFLPGTMEQPEGYGLYSYVLFDAPPTAQSRERYLKTIQAFLDWPTAAAAERYHKPDQVNLTVMPVNAKPPAKASADEVLARYNYVRAHAMLGCLPEQTWQQSGPFMISVLKPLRIGEKYTDKYLLQNLSHVPPKLIGLWMRDFRQQVEKPRFWETNALRETAKSLRTAIAIAAQGLPDVLAGLQTWIQVVQKQE